MFSIPDGSEAQPLGTKLVKKARDADRDSLKDSKKAKMAPKDPKPAAAAGDAGKKAATGSRPPK